MYKPSSFVASITLIAFLYAQVASVWALPTGTPEQKHTPTLLYLGNDPYTQALLRLQYDDVNNALEWQLLNNGLVLSSQSHTMPEGTESVDAAVVYDGDLIVVAGRTSDKNWFLRALNSQGEFQWQRSGEGRVYDLAFSDNGKTLYAVGRSMNAPLFIVVDADSGVIQFYTDDSHDDKSLVYKQVVTGEEEVVIALHNEKSDSLRLVKWRATSDAPANDSKWIIDSAFCTHCGEKKVRAVALQYDRNMSRFYLVSSGNNRLEFSANDIKSGQVITTRSLPISKIPVTWDRVVHIGSSSHIDKNFLTQLSAVDKTLFIASNDCHIFAVTSDSPDLPLIDLCEQPEQHHLTRKILQADEGSGLAGQDISFSEQRHFMNLEWILGAIGIVEVILLVSGIIGIRFAVKGYFKEKKKEREERITKAKAEEEEREERIRKAKDRELQRRTNEKRKLLYFRKYNPKYLFIQGGDSSVAGFEGWGVTGETDEDSSIALQPKQLFKKTWSEIVADSNILTNYVELLEEVNKLFQAARNMNIKEVEGILKDKPEYINLPDDNGNTVLHYAVVTRNKSDPSGQAAERFIKHLVSRGAQIEITNHAGLSPLILSAQIGNVAAFRAMIVSPNISLQSRSLIFHIITRGELLNRILFFQLMLEKQLHRGISFGNPCSDKEWLSCDRKSSLSEGGLTILHETAITGSYDIMQLIIKNHLVGVDEIDDDGNTALHYAVLYDSTLGFGAIKYLLYEGADTMKLNAVGVTPKDNSDYRGVDEIKEVLQNPQRKSHGQEEQFVLDLEPQDTPL